MSSTQSLSLYHLSSEYQRLLPQLYDPETGEVNMEVDAQLNELSATTEKKCIAVTSWIKKLEADKKEVEFFKEEMMKREAAFNKEIMKAHDYLKSNMERSHINEISCPYFTIKIKKNPYSAEVFDESQIPEKFMRTREIIKVEVKPDKNAIKEEVLQTGIQVPGVEVRQKTKLEIIVDKI